MGGKNYVEIHRLKDAQHDQAILADLCFIVKRIARPYVAQALKREADAMAGHPLSADIMKAGLQAVLRRSGITDAKEQAALKDATKGEYQPDDEEITKTTHAFGLALVTNWISQLERELITRAKNELTLTERLLPFGCGTAEDTLTILFQDVSRIAPVTKDELFTILQSFSIALRQRSPSQPNKRSIVIDLPLDLILRFTFHFGGHLTITVKHPGRCSKKHKKTS